MFILAHLCCCLQISPPRMVPASNKTLEHFLNCNIIIGSPISVLQKLLHCRGLATSFHASGVSAPPMMAISCPWPSVASNYPTSMSLKWQLLPIYWGLLEIEVLTGPELVRDPPYPANYSLGLWGSTCKFISHQSLFAAVWSQTWVLWQMLWAWRGHLLATWGPSLHQLNG